LVNAAIKLVPSKGDFDEEFHLEYIGFGLSSTSELSIVEAKKEVIKMGKLSHKVVGLIPNLLFETDDKKMSKTLAKVKKYEEISDRMEVEIADYLAKTSEGELSETSTMEVRGMLSIISDLERVADISYQMSKVIERKTENKIFFTPEQRENLKKMFELVDKALEHMESGLKTESSEQTLLRAQELESAINKYRDALRRGYLDDISKGNFPIQSGIIYNDLFSSMEKIGDHVINVSEQLAMEKGIKV
jgi:phosphate:Na+ symporter